MKILIIYQGLFGGSDLLFSKLSKWCKKEGYVVTDYYPDRKYDFRGEIFDLTVLTASQMDCLYITKKNGAKISRILIWILGMGMFQEAYFNPSRSKGAEFLLNKYLLYKSNSLVRKLNRKRALCYTDLVGMGRTLNEAGIDFGDDFEKNIIPIAINIPPIPIYKEKCEEVIHFGWVGRVSRDFKLIPLLDLMDNLNNISKTENIDLTIVGDGDAIKEIDERRGKMRYEIKIIKHIDYNNLGDFIRDNMDVLVAMGTSALDGGKVGVPTLVISPVRETDLCNVTYRWLHESKGYSLGEYPGINISVNQVKKNFKEVYSDFVEKYDGLGKRSYDYTLQFEEDKIFHKLMSVNSQIINSFIWRDIRFFYLLKKMKRMVKEKLLKRK